MQEILNAVLEGTRVEGIANIKTIVRPALVASILDVLNADGCLLGTPAYIGYVSGALEHFFDPVYYPCLTAKPNAPYGVFIRGNNDVAGASRAVTSIATAMGWTLNQKVLSIIGTPNASDRRACWELGVSLAASLMVDPEQ